MRKRLKTGENEMRKFGNGKIIPLETNFIIVSYDVKEKGEK